jgi:hypothetical protein
LLETLYEDFNNRRFITDLQECPKMVEGLVLIYSSFAFAPGYVFCCSCNGLVAFKEKPLLLFELPLVLKEQAVFTSLPRQY